jgi:hypothetical protein
MCTMSTKHVLAMTVLMLLTSVMLPAEPAGRCGRIFYLVETADGVKVESTDLDEGAATVLADPSIITLLIPFSPGSKSGDLSRTGDRGKPLAARCSDGRISSSLIGPDGGVLRDLPSYETALARDVDLRVNVTTHDGRQWACRIHGWDRVVADDGPVLDMFSGRIALEPGDYSITVETLAPQAEPDIAGQAPLVLVDDWLTVDAVLPGGKQARLLLDLGATTSVLVAGVLPEGTEIAPYRMVEYSDEGRREFDAVVPGAGGLAGGLTGTIVLQGVRIGDLVIDELEAVVIEQFPEKIAETGLDGIIGIDQLRRAGRLLIGPSPSDEGRLLTLGDRIGPLPPAGHEIPFTEADNKLFFKGAVNGLEVDFILDSGAMQTSIDPAAAAKTSPPVSATGKTGIGAGIDGTPIEMKEAQAETLTVGSCRLADFPLLLAELDVLTGLGLAGNAGLLGADFLARFERVEFDFEKQVMRLWEQPENGRPADPVTSG